MKKVFILTMIAAVFTACSSPSASTEAEEKKEVATIEEVAQEMDVQLGVDVSESVVAWKGTKPTGSSHQGTVAISAGKLLMHDGVISAGSFVMDLTKMIVTDEVLDDKDRADLLGHLGNGDFFEIDKYPSAFFEVSGVKADSLTGNLTIKDISKSIVIPYSIVSNDGQYTLTSSFSIDRTLWGITFNSGNYFKDLKNRVIDDVISFDVKIVTSK